MDFCGHTNCVITQCIFNYYIVATYRMGKATFHGQGKMLCLTLEVYN